MRSRLRNCRRCWKLPAENVGKVLQSRPTPDPHSFVGQGKAEEIRDLVKETGAKLVIF